MADEQNIVKLDEHPLAQRFSEMKLVEIKPAQELEDYLIQELLGKGVQKRLVIVYRPLGGNQLFFYNEQLLPIIDPHSLYHSQTIYFTNQVRLPGEPLFGAIKMDRNVEVHGKPSLTNKLKLIYPGGSYIFRDEYSLLSWSGNTDALQSAEAHIQ